MPKPRLRSRRRRRFHVTRAVVALAIGAIALGIGVAGPWGHAAAVAGAVTLLLACRERGGPIRLLGPFPGVEFKRSARTSRRHLWRPVYVIAAFVGLLWTFVGALPRAHADGLTPEQSHKVFEAANEWFFVLYAATAFMYVLALTVNVLSATVAEERDGRRWDVLRATDLTTREMLVGKSVGRLPQILDPFLTTVPVVALSTLLGGVSPRMILFLACGIVAGVVLVGGLTLLAATFCRTPAQIRTRVAVVLVGYLLLSSVTALPDLRFGFDGFLSRQFAGKSDPVWPVVRWAQSGNPYFPYVEAGRAKLGLEDGLGFVVRRFAAFAALVGLGAGALAVARFRGVPPAVVRRPVWADAFGPTRPVLRDFPVFWWERFGSMTPRQYDFASSVTWAFLFRLTVGLVAGLGFVRAFLVVAKIDGLGAVRVAVGGVLFAGACALIYRATFHGARCLSGERAAGTLEPLLVTPIGADDLLRQKWRALVLRGSPLAWCGVVLTGAATACGLFHPSGAIAFVAAVAVFVTAGAAVGLAFGAAAPTPEAAVRRLMIALAPFGVVFPVATVPPVAAGLFLFVGRLDVSTENGLVGIGLGCIALWGVAGAIAGPIARARLRKASFA